MECICLAGGLGTRLQPLLPDTPKCLAPVGDRAFLDLLAERLRQQGVRRLLLSLGHRHEAVLAHIRDRDYGMSVETCVEAEPLGTAGALRLALAQAATDEVLVVTYASVLACMGRAAEGLGLLQSLRPAAQSDAPVRAAYALVHFSNVASSPDETDAIQTARVSAAKYFLRADNVRGLETLFAAAERNRRYANSAGKDDLRKALELFDANDPQLPAARRRLASLLH